MPWPLMQSDWQYTEALIASTPKSNVIAKSFLPIIFRADSGLPLPPVVLESLFRVGRHENFVRSFIFTLTEKQGQLLFKKHTF